MILERGKGLRHEQQVMEMLRKLGPLRQKELIDEWTKRAKEKEQNFDPGRHGITRQGMWGILNRLLDRKVIQKKGFYYSINQKGITEINYQGFAFGDYAIKRLFNIPAKIKNLQDFSSRVGALITYTMLQSVKPSKEWSEEYAKEWINESISVGHLFKVFKEFIPFNHIVVDYRKNKVRMEFPLDKRAFEENVTEYKKYFPEFFSELETIREDLTRLGNVRKTKLEDPKTVRRPHENCNNEILSWDGIDLVFIEDYGGEKSKMVWRCPKCGITIKDS